MIKISVQMMHRRNHYPSQLSGGTTIVMVTHSEHDARYAQRIVRMLDGKVILENRMF